MEHFETRRVVEARRAYFLLHEICWPYPRCRHSYFGPGDSDQPCQKMMTIGPSEASSASIMPSTKKSLQVTERIRKSVTSSPGTALAEG